jgi:hypothetical protein
VLVLGAREEADATRLYARFARDGIAPGHVDLRPRETTQTARRSAAEPTGVVRCRVCGDGVVEMPQFLLDFLRDHRAPMPLCSSCRDVRAEREQPEPRRDLYA